MNKLFRGVKIEFWAIYWVLFVDRKEAFKFCITLY